MSVNISIVRNSYGRYAPLVLENTGYLRLVKGRKARGWRKYELLKELPSNEEYRKLHSDYFRVGLIDLYKMSIDELYSLMYKVSNQISNTHDHLLNSSSYHTSMAYDALLILRNCLSALEKHSLDNFVTDYIRELKIVFEPFNFYGKVTTDRGRSRNDVVSDSVNAFLAIGLTLNGIFGKKDKNIADFVDELFICASSLAKIRFTAYKTK